MRALIFIITICILTTASAQETSTDCSAMAESRDLVKKDVKTNGLNKKKTASKQ